MSISHPNLKVDYFKTIDTKEKAYWLGFLFADGSVCYTDNVYTLRFSLQKRDEERIDRFCNVIGANLNKKNYDNRGSIQVGITIYSKIFVYNLIHNGCLPQKSKRMNSIIPNLRNESLYLAFLLGFYDGDGGNGLVTSCDKTFLESINNKFGSNLILKSFKNKNSENIYYRLHLPVKLREKMYKNFKNSLKRKREVNINVQKKHIFYENKDNILKLSCVMSFDEVAKKYGMNRAALCKLVRKTGFKKSEQIVSPLKQIWNDNKENILLDKKSMTLTEISNKYKIGRSSIGRLLAQGNNKNL